MEENKNNENEQTKIKGYLVPLFESIENAYINQETLTFQIVEPKNNGFVIKISGLFAFIPFANFSWTYSSLEIWRNISETFIGAYFRGKVQTYDKERPSIFVDAKQQVLQVPNLGRGKYYKCVICNRKDYGAFIDLGVHFNWRYGSILGLVHKSSLHEPLDMEIWKDGDIIDVLFHGYDEKERLILGDVYSRPIPIQEKVAPIIGTIQLVNVKVDENGRYSFSVFDKFVVSIPIQKTIYPTTHRVIRSYLKDLKDGDLIYCELLKTNVKKDKLIAKLYVSEI